MHSFELKTLIAAPPHAVFAALTDPALIRKWDYCAWVQCDLRLAGKLRKRDEDGNLTEASIVVFKPPFRFAHVADYLVNTDDPEEGRFTARTEFCVDTHEDKSVLTFNMTGFPSEDLCARERNSWGGYYLEKLKKVAESHA